jgi:hypothetical protein
MANYLSTATSYYILTLHQRGWSQRRIAGELDVDRRPLRGTFRPSTGPQNQSMRLSARGEAQTRRHPAGVSPPPCGDQGGLIRVPACRRDGELDQPGSGRLSDKRPALPCDHAAEVSLLWR